jgi:hypothetical protein
MSRLWIAAKPDGKVQILLGAAATREKRRLGRMIDGTIARAVRGGLKEADRVELEHLARLAERIARTG